MSSLKQSPPFKAEHIGSLLRPYELINQRYLVADKQASPESLLPIEQASIRDIVKLQQECGFHAVTNGEHSRHQFWGTFFETLDGMEEVNLREGGYDTSIFRMYAPDVNTFIQEKHIPNQVCLATSKVSHKGRSTLVPEYLFLRSVLSSSDSSFSDNSTSDNSEIKGNDTSKAFDIKLTLPSPSWYHLRYAPSRAYAPGVYENDDEYFKDVAKAYQKELGLLYEKGVRNVQVDDPNLAYFCSEEMLKGWAEDESNTLSADEQFDRYLRFYNECFKRPADMHLGIHLCRGNYMGSRHFSSGAYDKIALSLFTHLDADTFYLEYDTPRAGGFEPLQYLPEGKNVVLGVVTSKFPELEDQKEMVERIYSAADEVVKGRGGRCTREDALKQLSVSPQCGFASHAEGNSLTREDMINKLKLVRAIADEVWPGQA
ncbi:hypothetical protein HD553DRAFT_90847 [Filobasidium floriforme]|uniref:uncharacterized protein n=1 Tax=Filobasidium floriforme TaxID=5210 RepID=UPI001E8E4D09|nr:uncharacterized protein HD553DRAFT_90847 [Filobasidium floriforme]KAH8081287.1 hypothetical protein HD553DRAFT_90847 [Filobasidium floriforme]